MAQLVSLQNKYKQILRNQPINLLTKISKAVSKYPTQFSQQVQQIMENNCYISSSTLDSSQKLAQLLPNTYKFSDSNNQLKIRLIQQFQKDYHSYLDIEQLKNIDNLAKTEHLQQNPEMSIQVSPERRNRDIEEWLTKSNVVQQELILDALPNDESSITEDFDTLA